VTAERAQLEIATLVARARKDDERTNRFHPLVRPLRERVSGAFRPAMLVLTGAVGLVMLIVCANLSNLLLTRTAARENEMALRVALGAGRGRLIRQLLTESVLLSSGGALLGLLLGVGGTYLLGHTDALSLPLLDQVRVDSMALGFAVTTAVLTGIVFGLAPALRVSAPAMHEALKDASRGSTGRRQAWLRSAIVISEVTLACVLLVGTGLLMRSFLRVLEVDPGFQPSGTIAVRIDPDASFPSPEARNAYYDDALARVRAIAGIDAAGLTDVLPFAFNRMWGVGAAGQSYARGEKPEAYARIVSDGFIRAMGIAMRAGRDFAAADNPSGRPIIIINEALARALFPGEDPLGRMVQTGENRDREIVGVVASTRHQTLEEEAGPEMYIPMRQTGDYAAVHMVVRGAQLPAGLTSAVRSALRPMDETLPMTEVRLIQDLVDRAVSPRRIIVMLLTGFAAFALVLASLGIYGVISYGVTQRRREIGVRIALGESAAALQTRILLQTMKLAAAGMVLGLIASWALGRLLQNLLFGVTFSDPLTFAAALTALTVLAALAGYLPARRAARVSPMEALRAS
jgi:predicted permease